jgi:antitoxin component YwqK of YwqJK toxin-antitoxin module
MKKFTLLTLGSLFVLTNMAQKKNNLTDKSLYNNTYDAEAVVDDKYGIKMYEPLNMMLGKDTVRNDQNGYAANGYEEDFYTTGQLLHKGFYVDGQLKIYKNYYPNGNVERNFRLIDLKKSKMTIYYEDGATKSNIVYIMSEALKWEDFYPNGTLEFVEEYNKSFEYYVFKANYFENGAPENTLELVNKKKLIYDQIYYHDNGNIKEQGQMMYNKSMFDYQKIGTWKQFDKNGSATKEIKYNKGEQISEKSL